jgi:regulator of RNase E activity RraB
MAKLDKNWTNYFEVLYPPPREMEKIQNRKVIDQLSKSGDALKVSRKIDHFLFFKTKMSRDEFLRALKQNGFTIEEMPDEAQDPSWPYKLHLSRDDIPDIIHIDRVTLFLWELAQKYKGKYDGWETYVIK